MKFELAQYFSDEYLEGKKVECMVVDDLSSNKVTLVFKDQSEVTVNGLIASKLKSELIGESY